MKDEIFKTTEQKRTRYVYGPCKICLFSDPIHEWAGRVLLSSADLSGLKGILESVYWKRPLIGWLCVRILKKFRPRQRDSS
jgi:hypothetical protein